MKMPFRNERAELVFFLRSDIFPNKKHNLQAKSCSFFPIAIEIQYNARFPEVLCPTYTQKIQ